MIYGGVVPFDSVWRTGANDPTRIVLPFDTRFEKTFIPKGEYSLYTIPTPTEWTLIFNTDLKEWPTDPNRSKDFVQVKMKLRKPATQQERLAINIEMQKYGGVFTITWDETEAFIPFNILKK
ncbi:hypothetical protein A4H97_25280 [Niastella yeongjuensis]|uniref:DUF2911 domain-containing protein n=1 Tax=Niastella yeongjuensis TaxID=354355 RepID=A0A1V9F2Z2_9BACT|nr:hypothetical protein A4H97_25280 [Niastella yeongjuensis]